jgi:signal peptidase
MKLIKAFYNLFFGLVVVLALLLLATVFPITGNYKVLIVQSGSMEPALLTGSLVFTKPQADYSVHDIITYQSGRDLITHRIFEKKQNTSGISYITKGDANKASDKNNITDSAIIGRVFLSVPYLGFAVDTAKKPWGFAFIVVLPALIIIGDELKKIIQEIKKIKANKKNKISDNHHAAL